MHFVNFFQQMTVEKQGASIRHIDFQVCQKYVFLEQELRENHILKGMYMSGGRMTFIQIAALHGIRVRVNSESQNLVVDFLF